MSYKTVWRFIQIVCLVLVTILTIKVTAVDVQASANSFSRVGRDNLSAQVIDVVQARDLLRQHNAKLDSATKSRNWKTMWTAIYSASQTLEDIGTMGWRSILSKEIMVTEGKIFLAKAYVIAGLTDSCTSKKRFDHGLIAVKLLRGMTAAQQDATLKAARGLQNALDKCLRFELMVGSRITNAELNYEIQIDATVPLRFDLKMGVLTGRGPIKKVVQSMKPDPDCKVTFTFTPVVFVIERMTINVEIDSSGEVFVKDIKLSDYRPGPLNETMTIKCKDAPTVTGPFANWGLLFLTVHDANNNMSIEDWTLGKPKDSVGSRRYDQKESAAPLDESTLFILIHTPVK